MHGNGHPFALALIANAKVGDQVLAYDFATGTTVAREVTATLPHTDWLLEAHFSDGTTMSVTEDHRFWSITDTAWVELQDLDTTDVLLTPDGATVTVDWLDWDAGADAPAWDLTVEEHHNFFVAADTDSEAVLVHNQDETAYFCSVKVPFDIAPALARIANGLDSSQTNSLKTVLGGLSEANRANLLGALASQPAATGLRMAQNAALAPKVAERAALDSEALVTAVLSGSKFSQTVSAAAGSNVIPSLVSNIRYASNGLDEAEKVRLAEIIFGTDRGAVAAEYLGRTGSQRNFVRGFAASSRKSPSVEPELRAWYEGSVLNSTKKDGWNYQQRIDEDYRWFVPETGPGTWEKITDSGLPTDLTTSSRTELSDATTITKNTRSGVSAPATATGSSAIGKFGEELRKAELKALRDTATGDLVYPEGFLEQATVRVRVKNGTETVEFEIRPDFLTPDDVANGELVFTYREVKASRFQQPSISTLTDNQAVFLAALRRGDAEILEITHPNLADLLDLNEVSKATIGAFELDSLWLV